LGSIAECQLLAKNAQKLTSRGRHHKPNGSKLPSLKKSAIQEPTPLLPRQSPFGFVSLHALQRMAAFTGSFRPTRFDHIRTVADYLPLHRS
jgi:hypothetical protein